MKKALSFFLYKIAHETTSLTKILCYHYSLQKILGIIVLKNYVYLYFKIIKKFNNFLKIKRFQYTIIFFILKIVLFYLIN